MVTREERNNAREAAKSELEGDIRGRKVTVEDKRAGTIHRKETLGEDCIGAELKVEVYNQKKRKGPLRASETETTKGGWEIIPWGQGG